MRFLSSSYERSFTHGLAFMLPVIYFLRMLGSKHPIPLQRENGEEFGGKSWIGFTINKQIFEPWNARLIHIPKDKKEWNAFCGEIPSTR